MQNNGWIKIHRKITSNPLWGLEEFTKGQAWVDLLLLANYEPGKISVHGKIINIDRGQVGWSEVKLSERWGWSRNKTRRFIKYLISEQQIEQDTKGGNSIITILNYIEYQKTEQDTEHQTKQQKDSKRYTKKEEKEGKEEKEIKEHPDVVDKSTIKVLEDSEFRTELQSRFPDAPVPLEVRKMQDWLAATGRRYKDYKAFAKNWLRKSWCEKLPEKLAEPITTIFDIEFMNAKNDFTTFYTTQNSERLEGNIMRATAEVMQHIQKLGREPWLELYKQTKRLGIHFYKFVTYKVTQEGFSYNEAIKAWDTQ
jgi:hypothetical protein